MSAARSHHFATGTAAFGHGLALTGFLLPWVVGEFGVRQQLTGLDLARLAGGAFEQGLAGDILMLPIARIALLLVPLAAINALLLLAAIQTGALGRLHAQRIAVWLALPVALISLTGLALVLLSTSDRSVLTGPGLGLPLAILGSVLALGSAALPPHRTTSEE